MLSRFTFWLRRTWQKLPMQLSVFGWPPLLSHCLCFILGTLVLQKAETVVRIPAGKLLVPVAKLGKWETEPRVWKETQKLTILLRQGERWCRTLDEALSLWRAPGRSGELYAVWSTGGNGPMRLNQALQKKAALAADAKTLALCGSDTSPAVSGSGVAYD